MFTVDTLGAKLSAVIKGGTLILKLIFLCTIHSALSDWRSGVHISGVHAL